MADFRQALQALARGELDRTVFDRNMEKLLRKSRKLAPQVLEELRRAYGEDLIDAQTYASLKKRVQEVTGARPDAGGDPHDATQVAGAADTTQMLTEAEREAIAAEARAATQIDVTRGDTKSTVDFDLSSPSTGDGSSWGTTGTSATGTGWAKPEAATPELEKIAPGVVIKERFRLLEVLGVGGMGTVYKGVDLLKEEARDRNPYVALKVLNEDFKQHPDSFIALQREASRQQKLAHPNIATVYDFDRTGSTVFITMELMEGTPLNTYIKKHAKPKGGLPFEEAWPIIEGLGKGLQYAHERNMVHSDFKPGNCFLLNDGTVKILDFGIARAVKNPLAGEAEKTLFDPGKLGALTPAYASAEMLEGKDPDPRDDIYALACVAYELLTGKHPFNKLPANTARDNKLLPAPVKGLKRRQMKGLLRGLAFSREDRSQTVAQFLEELEGKSHWYKNPFIVGGAVALIALLAGTPQLLGYLHRQHIDAVIADIRSGDADAIAAHLDQLPTLAKVAKPELGTDDEKRILDEARDSIIGYYEARIQAEVEADDYPAAERVLGELRSLYPDSVAVVEITNRFEDRRNLLLAQLNERYNAHLEQGRLLPDEQGDDIGDVLATIRKVDPGHPLLEDPRLSAAFAAQAEEALLTLDFDRARDIVDAGLALVARFAAGARRDVNLVNLSDKIRNARERAEQQQLIAEAEERLQAAGEPTELAAFLPVQDALANLAEAAPDHPMLEQASERAERLLAAEAERIRKAGAWARVAALEERFSPLVETLGLKPALLRLKAERGAHEARIDALLGRIAAAVGDDRLAAPATPNAAGLLEELAAIAPGSEQLASARDLVSRAHLRRARLARARGEWADARAALTAAAQLAPQPALAEALTAERQLVERLAGMAPAERERLLAEREAEAAAVRGEIERRLAAFEPAAAGELLATVERLEALVPTDPKVTEARAAVGARVAEAAAARGEAGEWEQAIDTVRDTIALLPAATTLPDTLGALREGARQALAAEQQQIVERGKARIAELLADPTFERAWDRAVAAELDRVQPFLPTGDPWLAETREAIARAYVDRAATMRADQRYEEAGNLLAKAERYAPALAALGAERQLLAAAEEEFRRAREEELRQAEIEGLKQTFLSQAKAREVTGAKETLAKLRNLLPADDPFLGQEVPKLLGDAYLKLALGQADKGNYLAALKLAKEGAELAPNNAELQKAISDYTVEGNAAELRQLFTGDVTGLEKSELTALFSEIQRANPTRYVALAGELGEVLSGRIEPLLAEPRERDEVEQAALLFNILGKDVLPPNDRLAALEDSINKALESFQVCKSCGLISEAMKAARLSKARELLAQARQAPDERNHPDLARVASQLEQRIAAAEQAFAAFEAERKRLEAAAKPDREALERAGALLTRAQELWFDRDYSAARDWLEQELEKLAAATPGQPQARPRVVKLPVAPYTEPSPQPCTDGLAGYGTRKRGQCFPWVDERKRGPIMVVVPAGGKIDKPFAISKYEVTYYDYNRYCEISKWCEPIPVSKDRLALPVTGISIEEARAYTEWLSKRTGATWRLPTVEEWEHAAAAGGKQPRKDYNCRLEQGGQVLKGQSVMSVNTGKPNGWGLYHYVGNVQEWATTANGVVARGGAFQDSFSKCDITLERSHDGRPDEVTGFRVVRELG